MSLFHGVEQVAVSGGTYVATGAGSTVNIHQLDQAGAGTINGFKELSSNTAHTALHNSAARFDAPRCHRNTRTTYLERLQRWALGQGKDFGHARLIWLTGGAGAGKSAIMQSFVERTAHLSVILGAFFFSRPDSSRNYAGALIPTLAYQLARAFPAAEAILDAIVRRDPLIFKASLEAQAHELIVRPLLHLKGEKVLDTSGSPRVVFIIDGLDECQDPKKQALILHVIATILHEDEVPVSFLVASRPEMAISQALQKEKRIQHVLATISLGADDEAEADIRRFIEDSFLDICDNHPLRNHIPPNWPDQHSVHQLVQKSSGHFIYAATAMKFISSSEEHPPRALQVINGLEVSRTSRPFMELDALYSHIIASARYRAQVLGILRHCVFTYFDNSVTAICLMHTDFSSKDIALFLSDVQALVSLSPNSNADLIVHLNHASLTDFLHDPDRSAAHFISREEYLARFMPRYFQLFEMDPELVVSSLCSATQSALPVFNQLRDAIALSKNHRLLHFLLSRNSPQNIWRFGSPGNLPTAKCFAVHLVSDYLYTIRDLNIDDDGSLYIQQFKIFIQMLADEFGITPSRHSIVGALLFASNRRIITFLPALLMRTFPRLGVDSDWHAFFQYLRPDILVKGAADSRSWAAIRSCPQSRLPWGSHLVPVLEPALKHLLRYSWTPEYLSPNRHMQWLRRTKPFKHKSLGSPRMASKVYSYFYRRSYRRNGSAIELLIPHGYKSERAVKRMFHRRAQCYALLKTVTCYLKKSDSNGDVAKLARKSLPKAALCFPSLMMRARRAMDTYVMRWDDSLDGITERARSMVVNGLD